MTFEFFISIYVVVINILTLIISVLNFVAQPRRGWLYLALAMLPSLMSNYYWGAYLLLMHESPTLSSALVYAGWNASYLPFVLLTFHFMPKKFRFHPLFLIVLLLIPLNIF